MTNSKARVHILPSCHCELIMHPAVLTCMHRRLQRPAKLNQYETLAVAQWTHAPLSIKHYHDILENQQLVVHAPFWRVALPVNVLNAICIDGRSMHMNILVSKS